MRILIADDHEIIRRGLRTLLQQHEGWEVWEASNGRQAVALARKLAPHVVVLDLVMPEMNGFEVTRQIKREAPKGEILVFTAHETEDYVADALRAGAIGYLLKSDATLHITAAVEALSEHKPYFTWSVSKNMLEVYVARAQAGASRSLDHLSLREREVVQLLAEGRSNIAASEILGVSVKTVEKHRSAAMRKLGAQSVVELIRIAVQHKVVEP
jgi:DNA-binding NarL/FixJ family response regulator